MPTENRASPQQSTHVWTNRGNLWHVLQRDGIPEIKVKVLWQSGTPVAGFTGDRRTNESKQEKDL